MIRRLIDMTCASEIAGPTMQAYGTSEGVKKEWDERGRKSREDWETRTHNTPGEIGNRAGRKENSLPPSSKPGGKFYVRHKDNDAGVIMFHGPFPSKAVAQSHSDHLNNVPGHSAEVISRSKNPAVVRPGAKFGGTK